MNILFDIPRTCTESDSTFYELLHNAQPGDRVRRVVEDADGTLLAIKGLIDSITERTITDSDGRLLAQRCDDEDDFVALFWEPAASLHPDPAKHHWVRQLDNHSLFEADEYGFYRNIFTGCRCTPKALEFWEHVQVIDPPAYNASLRGWFSMRIKSAPYAPRQDLHFNPELLYSQWKKLTDGERVYIGDKILRIAQMENGTHMVTKGMIASIDNVSAGETWSATCRTLLGVKLCEHGDSSPNSGRLTVRLFKHSALSIGYPLPPINILSLNL